MSDLTSQINQVLSNPEMLEQIKALSGLLGQSSAPQGVPKEFSNSDSSNVNVPQPKPQSPLDLLGADGLQTAMRFMPILSELKKDDETTQLLRAIKPFLSPPRQDKLEEAVRLLRIIRILPLLKNQGLMNLF